MNYEKWDLVAWQNEDMGDDFDAAVRLIRGPTIDGCPVRVGYVKNVSHNTVQVIELNNPRYELSGSAFKHRGGTIVRKDDIIARKQREHNQEYEQVKQLKTDIGEAKRKWRELPALFRWFMYVRGKKSDWINAKLA